MDDNDKTHGVRSGYSERGQPLTDEDKRLLKLLVERAEELGHTPIKSEVEEAASIKSRFGTWENAVLAAGLESPHSHSQHQKRLQARKRKKARKRV